MDTQNESESKHVKPQFPIKEDILGKTPYGKEKPGQDNNNSRISGLLGDVTYPLSIVSLIRVPLEKNSRERIVEELSSWKLMQESHDKRSGRSKPLSEEEQIDRQQYQSDWIKEKQDKV